MGQGPGMVRDPESGRGQLNRGKVQGSGRVQDTAKYWDGAVAWEGV